MIQSPEQQIGRLIPARGRLHAPSATVNRGGIEFRRCN